MEPILKLEHVKQHFPVKGGILLRSIAKVHAVDGVSFEVRKGETLGVVGESGCGKSTLGRTALRLYEPTSGKIFFKGKDITHLRDRHIQPLRRDMQMIFQDPYSSLNSRHLVQRIVEEPLVIHRQGAAADRRQMVRDILKRVGLPETAADRFPHEFSGGQRQRIGIARAMVLNPELIVCDEAVSALDVSIQSQVLNLLLELQEERQLTYIFISHDLAVVRHMSDRIAVMYLGEVVEMTEAASIYEKPLHPYTAALLSAIPEPDPEAKRQRMVLQGDVPSPIHPPTGCRFHPRCPYAEERCAREVPTLRSVGKEGKDHLVSCHFAGQLDLKGNSPEA